MLSCEGNAERRWKTTIGLKKATFARAHFFSTFLCRCFAWLQRETSRNFFEGNVARVLVHFFFLLPLMFTGLPLVATSISHVVTAAITKFSCRFSNKKVSFVFLSLALDLCRPFYRWASLACRRLSLFLCLSLALYSKFVDMTINLSLIL